MTVRSSRSRAGFTLIEALVVTAIIAVLFGLVTAAVMRGLHTAEDARVSVEIRQLENAVTACKAHFGVSYLPSRMVLRNNNWYDLSPGNPNLALEKRSKEILGQMFPRMQFAGNNDGVLRVNWTGTGQANGVADLNGAECLVYFLGGRNGTDGWCNNQLDPVNGNPANPAVPPASNLPQPTRVAAFYEFNPERLKAINPSPPPAPNLILVDPARPGIRVYEDTYGHGQPYVYFSSYAAGNDYSVLDTYSPRGGALDRVAPFQDPVAGRFLNPNSFQIVSAGRDGFFGRFNLTAQSPFVKWKNGSFATLWDQATPQPKDAPIDNLANFHPTKIGIPQ